MSASSSASVREQKGITRVVFDRGGNLYHGRVEGPSRGA